MTPPVRVVCIDGLAAEPDEPAAFEIFSHWHVIDGELHERPVGGCEFCDDEDEP